MNGNSSSPASQEQGSSRRRTLRSYRNREEGGGCDNEAAANASNQRPQPPRRRSTRPRLEPSFTDTADAILTSSSSTAPAPIEPATTTNTNATLHSESSSRGRDRRFSLFSRDTQPRRGRDSAVGSPSRGDLSPTRNSFGVDGAPELSPYEIDLSIALEDGLLEDNLLQNNTISSLRRAHLRRRTSVSHPEASAPQRLQTDADLSVYPLDNLDSYGSAHASGANMFERWRAGPGDSFGRSYHTMGGSSKRSRDKFEHDDGKDLLNTLKRHGAVTAMLYHSAEPDPEANDIWPNFRNTAKLPARYSVIDVSRSSPEANAFNGRPQVATQSRYELRGQTSVLGVQSPKPIDPCSPVAPSNGRPLWQLPVELVEQIIEHLNRDDIKSLRLVSRELNDYTSQAAFKTAVVPFNTEIYGMLGQEPTPDRKGKKRAKISRPEYWWKNANGDEVYNGHGLDVFRGFGRHILRYGMSFEVNEDSLSAPPLKSVTEQKTSFWGNYEWPFEEYRRFDAVAGLESAADETPRMKTAFSELTKVKELALSADSGLGWLNGPDRSIRARILQTSPGIFGSRQNVPDRRTQAQHELWNYIELMHARAGEDIRTASLYRLEGARPMTEAQEANLLAAAQPSLPFLDSHVPHEATPHDAADSVLSQPLEDPDMLVRQALGSSSANAGVLFTSTTLQHSDAAQVLSPIVPATLSKAQKEWLLETEWAQRAFLSSYMLSIIDNRTTFESIHTLNISSLSDRYVSMLNRADFWSSLPSLKDVTLMVVPGWRTVEKDEAGFVDTPRVDPTGQIDTFCALLQAQVARRSEITKLTIGFTAGGEHAEGLHARNKLLMPAPLLPLKARVHADPTLLPIETATVQEASTLRQALLRLPHLEELTVRNCWITPAALVQFVKVHDGCALKHLTLDSVSLTAILRPHGNAQAAHAAQQPIPQNAAVAQQMAGALWAHANNNFGGNVAPGNHQPVNNQVLNMYIQTLIVQLQNMQANGGGMQQQHHIHALQAQLQQQLQNAQAPTPQQPQGHVLPFTQNPLQQNQQAQQQHNVAQMMHLNHPATQVNFLQHAMANQNAPAAAPTNNATGSANSVLKTRPREGSWMDIIDQISPGTNLSDFDSPHSQADRNRTTSLTSISFKSCGYAKLPHFGLGVDQTAIEAGNGFVAALRNPIFTKRYNALSPAMLSSKWPFLGEIIQEVDLSELAALNAGWNLKHGWEDAEAARAVEFDGLLSGGTGRFTGKVQRSDRVDTATESAS
ncbi:hypothetical protein BU25DRAFT_210249 [Macroventuria anomochaeta]|uniref:Uncharacterized protein n=1 Tax=Macroventuria anomochaeta TaxID=301207 RepID=A0ACB6RMA3_9PLEO|nr:uncharacterized protein BU25DRAFT_210249 [Macroventuria anomochaeta]KAF2622525.1 hypothetical protein BU25DRAFT_210249 [Macroventuria anomochaeta]